VVKVLMMDEIIQESRWSVKKMEDKQGKNPGKGAVGRRWGGNRHADGY
jgi:hypothetical protein